MGFYCIVIVNDLSLQETLVSVAAWLESHPKEIVILACCHFEGIDDRLHESFILSLKKLFGSKLCPRKVCLLLVQLSYGVKTTQSLTETSPALHRNQSWPWGVCGHLVTRSSCLTTPRLQWDIRSCGLPSPIGGPTSAQHKEWSVTWTGTKTWDVQVSFIYTLAQMSFLTFTALTWEYFVHILCVFPRTYDIQVFFFFPPEGFFVSGLNLTADRYFIFENPKQSLRTLTFSNWECLRGWLEEQRPGSDSKSLNIIAGDFVGPLPLSSLVIALNQKLLRKNAVKKLWFYSTEADSILATVYLISSVLYFCQFLRTFVYIKGSNWKKNLYLQIWVSVFLKFSCIFTKNYQFCFESTALMCNVYVYKNVHHSFTR